MAIMKNLRISNISWFDIKTKFKKIIRSFFYNDLCQELASLLIFIYMKLVYHTSKVIYLDQNFFLNPVKNNQPMIMAVWHHRLIMSPFLNYQIKKLNPNYHAAGLSSKHGDGGFVAKILNYFGVINIHGSSRQGRKTGRGIDLANFKKIFQILKANFTLVITPDGPRGPNQKVNGQIINIAKISKVPILPLSYAVKNCIRLNSWDRMIIPLPFNVICYAFEEPILVNKEDNQEKLNLILETKINSACKKADEKVKTTSFI